MQKLKLVSDIWDWHRNVMPNDDLGVKLCLGKGVCDCTVHGY